MKRGSLFVIAAVTVCNLLAAIFSHDPGLVFLGCVGAASVGPMAFPIIWSRVSVPLFAVAAGATLVMVAVWILQGFPLAAFLLALAAAVLTITLAAIVYAGHRGELDRPFSRPASG